ncbi:MAG: ribosomal protein S18-alanine N-acetyltransferase [Candidatus Thermoplasmatota archaeon]|nr:ribosomal protein S18-alanine N-acetyltransferase [Candidatus Thermoplasmatota archaeon]
MVQGVIVRRVQARDLEQINGIAHAMLREEYSLELFTHLFERAGGSFMAALIGDSVIGFVLSVPLTSRTMRILMLAVSEENQSRGIGKMLLEACKNHSVSRMMNEIVLEVGVDNEKAVEFYSRNGFSVVSRIKEYYNDRTDAYVMKCYLPM